MQMEATFMELVDKKRTFYSIFEKLTKEEVGVMRAEMSTMLSAPADHVDSWLSFNIGYLTAVMSLKHDSPLLADEFVKDNDLEQLLERPNEGPAV